MISREDARNLLKEHVKTETLLSHSRETELVMEALAEKLGKDSELWAITGLLHDIDFDSTRDTPEKHGLVAMEILEGVDLPGEALEAIKRHNSEMNGSNPPESALDFALRAGETITGLLVATALVRPSKKLEDVKPKSVKKKFKDKNFAANCNRDVISECEKLDMELSDFIGVCLEAVKPHASEFGI